MDSSKKKLESKTKCALKIKTPKLFDESGNKTLPSPSNIMNIGIMNVYTNKTLAFSPNFDGLDCVSEFHNLYNNKKKESAFEVAISRVESLQENIFESGNLDDLMDGNSEKNSALKVLPCFFGVNNSQESKSKITKINDINGLQKKDSEAEIMINVYKDKRIRHKSPSNNKIEILNTVKMDAKNISKLKKMSIETPSLKRPECNSPKNSKKMNLHRKSNSICPTSTSSQTIKINLDLKFSKKIKFDEQKNQNPLNISNFKNVINDSPQLSFRNNFCSNSEKKQLDCKSSSTYGISANIRMNTDQNLSKGQKKHDTVVLTIKEKPIFQNTFEVNVSKMSKSPKHMKSKSFLIEKNDSPNKKKIPKIQVDERETENTSTKVLQKHINDLLKKPKNLTNIEQNEKKKIFCDIRKIHKYV